MEGNIYSDVEKVSLRWKLGGKFIEGEQIFTKKEQMHTKMNKLCKREKEQIFLHVWYKNKN
jgi:hypothetical protein